MLLSILALAFAASSVLASLIDVEERGLDKSSYCGQWDSVAVGSTYILYLDQWNISKATGSQCARLTSFSGTEVAWTTTWSWGPYSGIKSFTNIAANTGLNKQLSTINSIETSWVWNQNINSVVDDVTYDLFTSSSPGGSDEYEIMIFLANFNAGPISSIYSSSNEAVAAAECTLAGRQWNLYRGPNRASTVYSFLPPPGTTITNFQADLKVFFTYLTIHFGLSSTQYLLKAQAGTEATSGSSVTFTTSSYSLVIS